MFLIAQQKRLIERIVNVFETGTPEGDYAAIAIFEDGPHDIRQITYGRAQTTEYGNLRELIRMYAGAGGRFSGDLAPFVDLIGAEALTDREDFIGLLKRAGREDPVMRQIQDEFFDRRYFAPALRWADDHEFALKLSMLVIYDSFIHSGSIPSVIRQKFPEVPPNMGGDERAWTAAYVTARHAWLANHSRPIVRRTIYRTECFTREIGRGNWDLSALPVNANGTDVSV
jgi:chitosanase